MITRAIFLFILVFSLPAVALAQFEGTLEIAMTHKHGSGTMKLLLSKAGVRSETRIAGQGAQIGMVFLHLFKDRDVAYRIDDAQKSYTEIDLKAANEARAKNDGTSYQAKKVGVETVRGYSCVHALVTDADGNTTDYWASKEIASFQSIAKMMGPNAPANEGMAGALRSVGADGFPVKVVHHSKNSDVSDTTMELVKVDKKAPPASAFRLPEGYRKIELKAGGHDATHGPPGTQLPPAMKKQLEESFKNMTPEEREAAKQVLRQQGITIE
ncbi:MAG: DUF4412 domain-containing protein [Deltaproteobacteria bacterium]|nr:DUF4412 domain-containing protein [Deltaproteobacteria bacterium]